MQLSRQQLGMGKSFTPKWLALNWLHEHYYLFGLCVMYLRIPELQSFGLIVRFAECPFAWPVRVFLLAAGELRRQSPIGTEVKNGLGS